MIRGWIEQELLSFNDHGCIVSGYSATGKGMVLLKSLGGKSNVLLYLDFVLDNAMLKQDIFFSGTVIPVKATSIFLELSNPKKPLCIMVSQGIN